METENIDKAYQIGVEAIKNCESGIPHYNKALNDFLNTLDLKMGDSIPLLQAFGKGYHDENERRMNIQWGKK